MIIQHVIYNMLFIIKEAKETILFFSQEIVKVLWISFYFNIVSVWLT